MKRLRDGLTELEGFYNDSLKRSMNVLRVASAGAHDETVTIDDQVYQLSLDDTVTAGNVEVDIQDNGTRATETLTLTGVGVADETVTIGGQTYTWKATPSAANEVDIGVDAATCVTNLVAAINGGAGEGTLYGTGTVAHTQVSAADGTGDTVDITAKNTIPAVTANAIATTETMTNGSFGAATMSGGVDATAAETSDALIAAINANTASVVEAIEIGDNEILIVHKDTGENALATTETLAGANNAFAAATMFGGENPNDNIEPAIITSRVPTATEVALDTIHFPFPFDVGHALVQVRDSSGAIVDYDGNVTITDKVVSLSAGSTGISASDLVTVVASR